MNCYIYNCLIVIIAHCYYVKSKFTVPQNLHAEFYLVLAINLETT
jgi:hypothetical protein